jgi:hypothetical protein
MTVLRELSRYRLDLMGVQVRWVSSGTTQKNTHFSMGRGIRTMNWVQVFFVCKRIYKQPNVFIKTNILHKIKNQKYLTCIDALWFGIPDEIEIRTVNRPINQLSHYTRLQSKQYNV